VRRENKFSSCRLETISRREGRIESVLMCDAGLKLPGEVLNVVIQCVKKLFRAVKV
jgi:hypothetical protein